ncbi:MAG: DNA-processing protein DprA [Actinomycetota bacterium]
MSADRVPTDDPARRSAVYVARGSDGYPGQLLDLHDPPAGLFLRGRPLPSAERLIAIVGARACSPLGREIARGLGRRLGEVGWIVVSGAARGIDSASHEGALDAGAPTVAVLGSGIDVAYPASSAPLIERIAATGTVVSEYTPGVPAMPFRFPARNRIVAGLARALVVVEGEQGSGSLISAEHALDLGRTVMAVPGSIASPLSAVPNALIREGAALVRGVDDVFAELGIEVPAEASAADVGLSEAERRAFEAVGDRTLPEAVAEALGVGVAEALPVLLALELKGLVRAVGGRFERRASAATRGSVPRGERT